MLNIEKFPHKNRGYIASIFQVYKAKTDFSSPIIGYAAKRKLETEFEVFSPTGSACCFDTALSSSLLKGKL
jgi:hypothetical protein